MFGWLAEPYYNSLPYLYMAGGLLAALLVGNGLGIAAGSVLFILGALIWKMRH